MTATPTIAIEINGQTAGVADVLATTLQDLLETLGIPAYPLLTIGDGSGLEIRIAGRRVRFPRWVPLRARMLSLGRLLSRDEELTARRGVPPDLVPSVVREALTMRPAALLTDDVIGHWLDVAGIESNVDEARFVLSLSLSQRRSIANHALIAKTWKEARDDELSLAEIGEAVLVRLGPPAVSIELESKYLGQLLRTDPHRHRASFADVHRALVAELGLHAPSWKLIASSDLPAGHFRIRINDFYELTQPGLPPGHYLSLEPGEGKSVAIPAWRRCVTLREGEPPEDSPDVWTPLSYAAAELGVTLRARAAALVDTAVVDSWVTDLGEKYSRLVAMFRARASMEYLAHVIRRLLDERVSVRNLALVLERLLTYDEIQTPPPRDNVILSSGLTIDQACGLPEPVHRPVEHVRSALGPWILRKPDPAASTRAIVLQPELERALIHSLHSLLIDHVVDEVAAAGEPGPDGDGSSPPAVLASIELRAKLRDMLAEELPFVPVIAYQELPPEARVAFHKRIDLPPHLRSTTRTTETSAETFEPLLADAGGRPVLSSGLDIQVARSVVPPEPTDRLRRRDERLWDPAASPMDLVKQQWGVIVPPRERGRELLDAIKPLIEHRKQSQGGRSPWIEYVPSEMNAEASHKWISNTYHAVPEEDRPRYLLILGDLHEVALELQHALGAYACVGRLAFDSLADYHAYADKVIAAERRARPSLGCFLYAADDGSRAMMTAEPNLVDPCLDLMRRRSRDRSLRLAEPTLLTKTKRGLLDGVRAPGLLVTVTHGVGDALSYKERRRIQGALVTGRDELLTGDDVGNTRFLPDGIWFMFACYGAGTPRRSEYRTWVEQLCEKGKLRPQDLEAITKGALSTEEHPFVAALPKRALANPEGPLAVIAHIDLAWTYSYMSQGQSRFDRIGSALHVLLHQQFAGFAFEQLMRYCSAAATQLADYYSTEGVDPISLTRTWMLRQDLRGFILLGDPAVRLRVAP